LLNLCAFYRQMLLFGSFTEDETRSLLSKQSSGKNEKSVEKNQLQFGSLNSVTVESNNLQNSSKASVSAPPSDSQKCNGVKNDNDTSSEVPGAIRENGSITNFSTRPRSTSSVNEVEEKNSNSFTLLDEDGPSNKFSNLSLDASETENLRNVHKTGNGDDSSLKFSHREPAKAPNGHAVLPVKDILPRGLINSGNLCFLNATVQALLSCSPFVHLLQQLRTRNIPKVSLSAAACQLMLPPTDFSLTYRPHYIIKRIQT